MLVILRNLDSFFLCSIIAMMDYDLKTIRLSKLFLMPLGIKCVTSECINETSVSVCTVASLLVQTVGRNEPEAEFYWCYVVNVCFENTFPTLPHALAPHHLSSFKIHATSGKQSKRREEEEEQELGFVEEKRGGGNKFSGCMITQRAESEKLA